MSRSFPQRGDVRAAGVALVLAGAWLAFGAHNVLALPAGSLDPAFATDGRYVADSPTPLLLRVTSPSWLGSPPFTETYTWYRCDDAGGSSAAVPGAASGTHTPTDRTGSYRVGVTGTSAWGSAPSPLSAAVRLVGIPDVHLTATSPGGAAANNTATARINVPAPLTPPVATTAATTTAANGLTKSGTPGGTYCVELPVRTR